MTTKPTSLQGEFVTSGRIYNTLVLLLYMLDQVAPKYHWRNRLKSLLLQHENWLGDMGFAEGWQTRAIWQ